MQENTYVLGFTAGELSPWLATRFDLQAYQRGAALMQNWLVQPYGGVRRRSGTEWVADAAEQQSGAVRLFPFHYSESDVLMLELFPRGMRVYRGGELVCRADGEVYVLELPWEEASVLESLELMQVNDVVYVTHAEYPPYVLSRYGDAEWQCNLVEPEPFPRETHVMQSEAMVLKMSSDGLTGELQYEGDAGVFSPEMAGREVVLMDVAVAPRTVHVREGASVAQSVLPDLSQENVLSGATYYRKDEATGLYYFYYCRKFYQYAKYYCGSDSPLRYGYCFLPGAMVLDTLNKPFEVCGGWELQTYGEWDGIWELWRSYDTSDVSLDFTQWEWVTLHSFQQSGTEGRKNWAFSGYEDKPCRMLLVCRAMSTLTLPDLLSFRILGGARPYKLLVAGVDSERVARVEVKSRYFNDEGVYSSRKWSFGAFGVRNGYPSFCNLHQGRLWYGGTKGQPTTLFGSAVDDYGNFGVGSQDDAALHLTLATTDQSRICWICPARSLLVGTSGSEWTLSTASGQAITASTAMFSRQSSVGSDRLGAHGVENTVFYVQRGGKRLREISYKLEADGFTSTDTSLLAEHLFASGVKEWAVQRGSSTQLWVLMRDGLLAVLTMNVEQQVTAWQRVALSGRDVLHVASLTSMTTHEDELWLVVRNRYTGVVSVERMVNGGAFLDGVVRVQAGADGDLALHCPHLAGGRAFACAGDDGGQVVDLQFDEMGDAVLSGVQAGVEYTVGAAFESLLQTLPQERDASFGTVRQVGRVVLRLQESDPGFSYCTVGSERWEVYEPERDGRDYPYTGAVRVAQIPSPGVGRGFCVRYDGAFDFRLLSLVMEVDFHGR